MTSASVSSSYIAIATAVNTSSSSYGSSCSSSSSRSSGNSNSNTSSPSVYQPPTALVLPTGDKVVISSYTNKVLKSYAGESEEKRAIRLKRNRETARATRMRNRKYLDELNTQISALRADIAQANDDIGKYRLASRDELWQVHRETEDLMLALDSLCSENERLKFERLRRLSELAPDLFPADLLTVGENSQDDVDTNADDGSG